jgi:formylglycine-generating enzyme required for sulfatase activity
VSYCPGCGAQIGVQAHFCPKCGASLAAPTATGLLPAQTLLHSRYLLLYLVAQGGMGAVYQAADLHQPGTVWAVKEMSASAFGPGEQAQALAAFQREANLLLNLSHPHLPCALDLFEEQGRHFLVMAFVEGNTLQQRLDQAGGPLPAADVLRWAGQLCDVLGYLHAQQPPIIYRDLKPANVMIDRQGNVQLIDFGIARFQRPGRRSDTILQGTEGYASPEHYGQGQTEPRSDLYCLGATLYHLLTGQAPPTVTERLLPPPAGVPLAPQRQLNSAIPHHVEAALLRALDLRLDGRFGRADAPAAAMAEMKAALQGQAAAQPHTKACPQCGKPNLAASLACFACGYDFQTGRAPAAPPPALVPAVPRPPAVAQPPVRYTPSGLAIATPDNLSALLALPQPPARIWWERAEMEMCLVPAGEFLMGSADTDSQAGSGGRPQHRVVLDAYYIGRYTVTHAQYARFVQATGHRVPSGSPEYNWDDKHKTPPQGKGDHPVVLVSWHDAAAYCTWAGLRLPTEAEWEKAARGTKARIYPWGDPWDTARCNSSKGRKGGTTPVGAYSPAGDSPYGCADMAGNVWEWCADWHDAGYYAHSPSRNPRGPDSGQCRVLRGGSWINVSDYVRSAIRLRINPGGRDGIIGFRCGVSSAPSP